MEQEQSGGLGDLINSFLNGQPVSQETLEQMTANAVSSIVGRRVSVEEIRSGKSKVGQIDIDWDGVKLRMGEVYSRVSSSVSSRPAYRSRMTDEERAQREAQKRAEQQQSQKAREKAGQISKARRILGYTAKEPVTKDMLKQRHRELARKHHPDRGGSVARMQDINWAVDILLAPA